MSNKERAELTYKIMQHKKKQKEKGQKAATSFEVECALKRKKKNNLKG